MIILVFAHLDKFSMPLYMLHCGAGRLPYRVLQLVVRHFPQLVKVASVASLVPDLQGVYVVCVQELLTQLFDSADRDHKGRLNTDEFLGELCHKLQACSLQWALQVFNCSCMWLTRGPQH